VRTVYPRLEDAQKRGAERFLFQRAEAARADARSGKAFGNRRLLGPLAAPDWLRHRATEPSPQPFVALRAYHLRWHAREALIDPGRVTRTLVFESSGP
jgi:hypothetical protein